MTLFGSAWLGMSRFGSACLDLARFGSTYIGFSDCLVRLSGLPSSGAAQWSPVWLCAAGAVCLVRYVVRYASSPGARSIALFVTSLSWKPPPPPPPPARPLPPPPPPPLGSTSPGLSKPPTQVLGSPTRQQTKLSASARLAMFTYSHLNSFRITPNSYVFLDSLWCALISFTNVFVL